MNSAQQSTIKPLRLVILLSGRGSNFLAILNSIKSNELKAEIALVVSDNKNAAGLVIAQENGIRTQIVERDNKTLELFSLELLTTVKSASPDLIVLAGFMRVLSSNFIGEFLYKIINIHPSLLPSFKGLKAQEQALKAGVKIAGCTVHYVTEEVDGGPIIAQAAVRVLPNDTAKTLSARILKKEHQILPMVINDIAHGYIKLVYTPDKTYSVNTKPFVEQGEIFLLG